MAPKLRKTKTPAAAPPPPPPPAKKSRPRPKVADADRDEDVTLGAAWSTAASAGGTSVTTTDQAERMMAGIELPSLAYRYLCGNDALILGRALMIIGLPGACKSTLLADMYRWTLESGGLAANIENENKDIADLRNAIMRHNKSLMSRLATYESNSQEEWMQILNGIFAEADTMFAKSIRRVGTVKKKPDETAAQHRARAGPKVNAKAPGWLYPIMVGVDSLTATSSEVEQKKIHESGIAERSFSWESQALAKLGRTFAGRLRGKPLIFVATNHLKPGQDDRGKPVDNVPGGKAMRFMDTSELKLVKVGQIKSNADVGGVSIKMNLIKNSLGPTGNSIVVNMGWQYSTDEATGELHQDAAWDWETAAIQCLMDQKTNIARYKRICDVVDLHDVARGLTWSKELGFPSTSPVPMAVLGAALERRPDILRELYPILHIKTRNKFRAGTDYNELMEALRYDAETNRGPRAEGAYARVDLPFLRDAADGLAEAAAAAALAASAEDDE